MHYDALPGTAKEGGNMRRAPIGILFVCLPLLETACQMQGKNDEERVANLSASYPLDTPLNWRVGIKGNFGKTVGQELAALGAFGSNGILFDRCGKVIKFYEITIPGAEAVGHEEKFKADLIKLEKLRREFTVIVITKVHQ